jgi:hypothetical protein
MGVAGAGGYLLRGAWHPHCDIKNIFRMRIGSEVWVGAVLSARGSFNGHALVLGCGLHILWEMCRSGNNASELAVNFFC